jgi:hypothetical protein
MGLTTKHTKSTKEENYFSNSMLSTSPIFVSFAIFVVIISCGGDYESASSSCLGSE